MQFFKYIFSYLQSIEFWRGSETEPFDPAWGSAREAARAIQRKKLSSYELTKYHLERISRYNPRVNAINTLIEEQALARARKADKAQARGELWGPFHGVPCTVKDAFEMAGVRTTAGEKSLEKYVAKRNAVIVARLLAAGAIILGKTNLPRMSDDWQSYNDIFGTTNNPWDVQRTPGGSSGGSAAAVAAGFGFLSLGSDRGGSVRIPAHFCGVYGHKPTLHLLPLRGHIPPLPGPRSHLSHSDLAAAGPLTRSAYDLRAVIEVLADRPMTGRAASRGGLLPPARRSRLRDYRIGFVLDDKNCPVTASVREVLSAVIDELRKVSTVIDEGWPEKFNPAQQYRTYLYLLDLERRAQYDELSDEEMQENQRKRSAASQERSSARSIWQDYFRSYDAFLLPTAFVPAFPHDHREPLWKRTIATAEGLRPYIDLRFWISFATLAGLPATTAPVGLTRDNSLPVGIQIMGPYMEDATPIDIASKLAELTGGFRPPPGFSLAESR